MSCRKPHNRVVEICVFVQFFIPGSPIHYALRMSYISISSHNSPTLTLYFFHYWNQLHFTLSQYFSCLFIYSIVSWWLSYVTKTITYQKRKFHLSKSMDYKEILTPFPVIESWKRRDLRILGLYKRTGDCRHVFWIIIEFAWQTFSNCVSCVVDVVSR